MKRAGLTLTLDMSTGSWIFPVAQPQQMQYQREATFVPSHSQMEPQSPAMAVHLAMNRADASSPQNVSSGNHTPALAAFTFHDPPPSDVLNGGHTSTYTGRSGLPASISNNSSFQESCPVATPTSENHSPHRSPYIGSGGVMSLPTSLPLEHYGSPYVERPADVQLLHCSQCTQRFASQEHFACVSPLEPPEACPVHIPTCSF